MRFDQDPSRVVDLSEIVETVAGTGGSPSSARVTIKRHTVLIGSGCAISQTVASDSV
jgi:hypothetical protein